MVKYDTLKTVHFSNTEKWNVKCFFSTKVKSKFKISNIGEHTIHITEKTKLFEEPEKEFKILGISNDKGMFDAYSEYGKNINQPYIHVENGYLAYNPYRVNVGSIGLKTDNLNNEYISPAYVVFKCKESILPEYLYVVLKSSVFNTLIRENTTGSVRQTLSYENLAKIRIPVPSLKEQQILIYKYNELIRKSREVGKVAEKLESSIDEYLFKLLDIEKINNHVEDKHILKKTTFKNLMGWGAKINSSVVKPQEIFKSYTHKNLPIHFFCELNPTTNYPHDIDTISFVPMECVSDIHGEIIEQRKGKVSKAKGYTRFMENDVLWAKITPCMQNGKCAIANSLVNGFGYGSTEFHVFRVNENALPEYIYCFLRTKTLREAAKNYFTGSAGQQRVGMSFLCALTIPKIPISSNDKDTVTQEKIVDYIFTLKKQIKETYIHAENLCNKAQKDFEEAVFDI